MKRARYWSTGGNQLVCCVSGLKIPRCTMSIPPIHQNQNVHQAVLWRCAIFRESQRSRNCSHRLEHCAPRACPQGRRRILTANSSSPLEEGSWFACRRRLAASLGLANTLDCKTEGNTVMQCELASIVHFSSSPKFFRADVADPFAPRPHRVCKRYSCRSSHNRCSADDDLIVQLSERLTAQCCEPFVKWSQCAASGFKCKSSKILPRSSGHVTLTTCACALKLRISDVL